MGTRTPAASSSSTASDVDAQRQMEQAECFLDTIMDERAAQDALDLDTCAPSLLADALNGGAITHAEPHAATRPAHDDGDDYDDREARDEDDDDVEPPVSPIDSLSSSEGESPRVHAPPAPLALALLESSDQPVQWDLISPWSESEQDDDADCADTTAAFFGSDSSAAALYTISEPEPEAAAGCDDDDDDDDDDAGARQIEARLRALIKSESDVPMRGTAIDDYDDDDVGARTWPLAAGDPDDDDEEFEVFNAMSRSVATAGVDAGVDAGAASAELVDEPLESSASDGADDDDEDAADDCTRTSVATTLDESCDESPRASAATAASRAFGRRAQTYSGAASASVQSAFAKLRSRTLSTTSSFRQSSQCSSTTTSEAEDLSTSGGPGSEYESDRGGSFYSDIARGSSMSGSRPTLVARLGSVGSMRMSGKMGGFLRFRSSSATTTASEESYCADCVAPGEAQSAPSLSAIDAASAHQQQQRHVQMQALKLKASAAASKAAVYLNAASTEAARKLKSRTMRKTTTAMSSSSSSDECDPEHMSVVSVGVSGGGA